MGALADMIVECMDSSPGEWRQGDHVIRHSPSGIEVWASNGFPFVSIYSGPGMGSPLSILDKWRISRAVGRCNQANAMQALGGE